MLTLALALTGILIGSPAAHAEEKASAVAVKQEFKKLVAIEPSKRTKGQRARIRVLWREESAVQKANDWYEVLQKGDSVLDFPGVIGGKTLRYLAEEKCYALTEIIPSTAPEEDTWERFVLFSEDGFVISKVRLKMNSR